jgi:phosphoribosylamine-glycine ligase
MTAVHVVMTSEGYPDTGAGMKLGQTITLKASTNDNTQVFFAGVKQDNGSLVNAGGRVLGVTALGNSIESARAEAYAQISGITFDGAHWRKDIGG